MEHKEDKWTSSDYRHIETAEAVTEGHPDKLCDRIVDAILDEILSHDPQAHVACEAVVTTGIVFVFGEISTDYMVNVRGIVRDTLKEIGYTSSEMGLDAENCAIISSIHGQSDDINSAVGRSLEAREGSDNATDAQGAGDQGIMFGYAVNETPTFMPLPIILAQDLAHRLAQVRKKGIVSGLRPDGKTQVSVEYEGKKAKRVDAILVSAQHDPDVDLKELKEKIWKEVVLDAIDGKYIDSDTRFIFNPSGRFEIGGPQGDSGLTGRKLIVDTYGGRSRHGGGAFSGKDPSKVDRSAAYFCRYVAKNLVASGLCEEAEVAVSYAIGKAEPFSIDVTSFGSSPLSDEKLCEIVEKEFDFRPSAMIRNLDLRRPIYTRTSCYGHFGRNEENFTWERTDRVEDLRSYLK